MIMIGFAHRIIAVSTYPSELGQEMFGFDEYKNSLAGLTISIPINKMISIGDGA